MRRPSPLQSNFRLLRDFQRIIQLDTQVLNGAFQLGVSEQKLNSAQVFGTPIDQRGFCSPQRVRAVDGRIKTNGSYLILQQLGKLACR